MISIIIPAHNEAKLIGETIDNILMDNHLSDCEIIVVCNGCTDDTAQVANNYWLNNGLVKSNQNISFHLLNTPIPSKTNALNLGIQHAKYSPIVLLDADILIDGLDIIKLVEHLYKSKLLAVSPRVKFDSKQSSLMVKAYYKVASCSNYNQFHRLSNVIALSKEGVKRVGLFPELIADDEYLRRQFTVSEYSTVEYLHFTFICPKNLSNLLNVLTRVERGNLQLRLLDIVDRTGAKLKGFSPYPLIFKPLFLVCKVYAKIKAKYQYKRGNIVQWERDESNR
ncbi:glycosyltransferase family 2 protein [Colwelliaceae bacterium 6471]